MSLFPPVLGVLASAKLLLPEFVVMRMPEDRPLEVPPFIKRTTSSWQDIRLLLDEVEQAWSAVVPMDVEVYGTGTVVQPAGVREFPDVVGISAIVLGTTGLLKVATWCDAWLPHDLRGRPQPEIHAANAPRLRAALAEIERVVGFSAESQYSKFSIADGHVLSCQGDEEDPLEMAWLGYDDSWIVAE